MRPYLEKTQLKKGPVELLKVQALSSSPNATRKKKDWQSQSSNRVPAQQARDPEFKPQCDQRKKGIIMEQAASLYISEDYTQVTSVLFF
jgi:hypothetical protein